MEQLLTACRDLVSGTRGQRERAWARLPGLVAAGGRGEVLRGRAGVFRVAEVLAIGAECAALLECPEATDWADRHLAAGQSLPDLRTQLRWALIRRAVPAEADDTTLCTVFGPALAGGDLFARVRHWADWFVPGRERMAVGCVPDAELRAGADVGLLVPDHDGRVGIWPPLLVFLWHDRLRAAIRAAPDNAFALIRQVATARCWGPVLELLAARLEREHLVTLLQAITTAEGDEETEGLPLCDQEHDIRLLVAARCLGRVGDRLPADNPEARDVANRAVSLALGEFGSNGGHDYASVRKRVRLARSVEGVGRWLCRLPGRATPGEWVQEKILNASLEKSPGWELLRHAPRLCVAGDVLDRLAGWLDTNMPTVLVRVGSAPGQADQERLARFVADVVRSIVPYFARDPLLASLTAALNAGGVRARAAIELLPLVGPNEAVRVRLEPLLVELIRSGLAPPQQGAESADAGGAHDPQATGEAQGVDATGRLAEAAAHAAWGIGSTHPDVLDLVARGHDRPMHFQLARYTDLRPRLRGRARAEAARLRRAQRRALAARVLARCRTGSVPPTQVLSIHTLTKVLRGAGRGVVRRLAELALSLQPDVVVGALELLVAHHAETPGTPAGPDPLSVHLAHPAARVRLNALRFLLGERCRHTPPAVGLARAICDRVADVRTRAVEVAAKFWRSVGEERLVAALDGALEANAEAWHVVAALWRRASRGGTQEALAGLLRKHDESEWRRTLIDALELGTGATDDELWHELGAGLESGGDWPGGVVAWLTPRSPMPAEVQCALAGAMTRPAGRSQSARDVLRALAARTPLPGVWEGFLAASSDASSSEWAIDGFGLLAQHVSPPHDIVARLNDRVANYPNSKFAARSALRALAKIGSHHLTASALESVLKCLSADDDDLRRAVSETLSACSSESAAALSPVVTRRCLSLPQHVLQHAPQYLLAPLAGRGDAGCLNQLIDLMRCADPDVRGAVVREFEAAGLASSLPVWQIERLLATSGQGSGAMRRSLVEELLRRPGRRNLPLLRALAADEAEDERARAAAGRGVAEAPGWWPFATPTVAALVSNGSSPYLRPAVVAALPAVYPDGLPQGVVRPLLSVAENWERVGDLAGRFGPNARVTLAEGVVEAICTGSPQASTAVELLQSGLFAHATGSPFARLWDAVAESNGVAPAMRRQIITWFAREAQKWLGHGKPPGAGTAWFRDRLTVGLCGGRAGAAAARVLGRLAGAGADPDLLEAAAAGVREQGEHARRVSRVLVRVGYVRHQNRPMPVEAFVRDYCPSAAAGQYRVDETAGHSSRASAVRCGHDTG